MLPVRFLCAVVALAALAAAPADAAPCQKPRQLKLVWDASKAQGQLVFVAYGCGLPAACPTQDDVAATKLPVKVTLRSGTTTLFETQMRPCDGETCRSMNTGGCAGTDAHRAREGMVKFSYQRRGTASIMARLRGPMGKPSETAGPITISLSDGTGYAAEVEFEKCRFSARANGAILLCR